MFQCKSCGGGLRFDIESQSMYCDHCQQTYDPYAFMEEGSAEENTDFDVTIYTCPSCGAQLGAVETSAAEFCSYCGSSVVLDSRLSKMKKPQHIIPFKKTKEDCRSALSKRLNSAFFVPKDFRDSKIDNFRGIYIPYWNYKVVQQGKVTFHASKLNHSKGNYDYYDNYQVSAMVDSEYDGISHDASEDFADRMSEALEPYNYKERQEFTPGYLCGFYADIQDVKSEKYELDAKNMANKRTYDTFVSKIDFDESDLKEQSNAKNMDQLLHTELESTSCTMVPVWFLSYRRKDRVAYAAVNGETGKVVSDLPIDMKKIYILILILAIPLYFLLESFVSMRASSILLFSVVSIGIASVIYLIELYMIEDHEKNINTDRAQKKSSKKMRKNVDNDNKIHQKKKGIIFTIFSGVLTVLFCIGTFLFGVAAFAEFIGIALIILVLIPFLSAIITPIIGIYQTKPNKRKGKDGRKDMVGFILLLIVSILDILIYFVAPVSDIYYYAGAVISLGAILYSVTRIINLYNIFTTRPLPQFKKRGGKEHA